jgi:CBS domain-containing protein
MKTSVIRYRVADFLREHPPFDLFSLDDLLAFCGTGRVVFHEDDVRLFSKGEARDPVIRVVQQGRVEILAETPAGEHLQDVLGPGDILGLGRSPGGAYSHTARTATEVILYSFDLSAFEALVGKYPEADRFLFAHTSAAARQTKALHAPANRERLLTERERAVWVNAAGPPTALKSRPLTACGPELAVREVAKLMGRVGGEAVAVVGADGHPLGLITSRELVSQVATGAVTPDAPAGALMNRRFPTAPPGLRSADYFLRMLPGRGQWLLVTADGSAQSPLQNVLADSDLAVHCGRNPVLLLREMLAAETVADLAYLYRRAGVLLAEGLVGSSVVEWFSLLFGEINAVLAERLVWIASQEMARAGRSAPALPTCWLFFGRAGRRESLTPAAPWLGLVYADPPPGAEEEVGKYFSTLVGKVAAKLQACGLRAGPGAAGTARGAACRTLSEWREFYVGLIRDPIGSAIYSAREYLDFQVVGGDRPLGLTLKEVLFEELGRSEVFIPVLANDTLANLPPLTFYQGSVIESDGALRRTLDVEQAALTPVVDAARVLALAGREVAAAHTLERLRLAAVSHPQYASTLNDAAEGWRVFAYHQALAEISTPGGGSVIQPQRLSRFEQRLLKSAFDATRRCLELTSTIYNLAVTR